MQSGDGTAEKIMRRVETGGGANEVHGFSRKCDSRVFQCAYAQLIQIRAWLLRVSPNIAKKNFGMVEEASFVSKTSAASGGLVVDARLVRLKQQKEGSWNITQWALFRFLRGISCPPCAKNVAAYRLARNRIQCGAGKEKQTGRHIRRQPGKRQLVAPKRFITTETRAAGCEPQNRYPRRRPGNAKSATLERFPGQRQKGLHAKGLPAENHCAASRSTTWERTPHGRGGISTSAAIDRAPRISW